MKELYRLIFDENEILAVAEGLCLLIGLDDMQDDVMQAAATAALKIKAVVEYKATKECEDIN